MNNFTGTGYLTSNALVTTTSQGSKVAKFTLGIRDDDHRKNDTKNSSDFFNCVAYDKAAEFIETGMRDGRYQKGCECEITGRVHLVSFTNDKGALIKYLEVRLTSSFCKRKTNPAANGAFTPVNGAYQGGYQPQTNGAYQPQTAGGYQPQYVNGYPQTQMPNGGYAPYQNGAYLNGAYQSQVPYTQYGAANPGYQQMPYQRPVQQTVAPQTGAANPGYSQAQSNVTAGNAQNPVRQQTTSQTAQTQPKQNFTKAASSGQQTNASQTNKGAAANPQRAVSKANAGTPANQQGTVPQTNAGASAKEQRANASQNVSQAGTAGSYVRNDANGQSYARNGASRQAKTANTAQPRGGFTPAANVPPIGQNLGQFGSNTAAGYR